MKRRKYEILIKAVFVVTLTLLTSSVFVTIPSLAFSSQSAEANTLAPPEAFTLDQLKQMLGLPSDGDNQLNPLYGDTEFLQQGLNLGDFLVNYESEYNPTYQPWKSKAAVRCIAVTDDYQYVAVGGGYLYDNEVHIYRWNPDINQYVKVWNSGDNLIKGDVTDVDIADTDHNNFLEIVATSTDGHFYVFEQKHIYDPYSNTENMFEHVFTSPYIGQAWAVELNDTDKDFDLDIIVASWDYKIHVYEYTVHSGYPFSPEHWITYEEKWVSRNLGTHPTSLVVGDTNYNGLPDFVVGTREGSVYVFENNGTILDIHGQPFPICQDNSYHQIYFNNETIWRPIYSMAIGNLDNRKGDEVGIAAFAFNAYVLRYNTFTEEYYIQKLIKGFESWTLKDDYPADEYIDWGVVGQNSYLNLQSTKLGTSVLDPVNYTSQWYFKGPYPYNSGASTTNYPCQINFTTGVYFKPNATHSAWEIFDFGADEEGTGNGNSKADFLLSFNMTLSNYIYLNDLIISISPDNIHWMTIPAASMVNSSYGGYRALAIDVDPVLSKNKWDYFRYVNVTVKVNPSQEYWLFGGKLNYVNMPVSTALSVTVGTLASSTGGYDLQLLFGTVDGRLVAFKYDATSDEFVLSWDSWVDDRYSLRTNIWALQQVQTTGVMPDIIGYTYASNNEFIMKANIESQIPAGQSVVDFAFGDIDRDPYNLIEWLVSTSEGNVYAMTPGFNNASSITDDYLIEINEYAYYDGLNITVAVAEIDKDYYGPEIIICSYNETKAERTVYDDYELDLGKQDNSESPIMIDIWGRTSSASTIYHKKEIMENIEITGQLLQMFYEAQSLPSIDGRDIDGDGDTDLVLSLDNLYLLENVGDNYSPEFVLNTDYFKDVNEVRGKRKYLYPQFVEFDHDDDWDLVIGYSNRLGATYFDNYGTVDNPKWIEKKSLVSNMDEEANINVYNLSIPVFLSWEDYSPWYADQMTASTGTDYSKRYAAFYMKNIYTEEIYSFFISYSMQTSYLAAINPALSRLEVNSFKNEYIGGDTPYYKRNFGFRAIESWSTRLDLYNWTLTLDTADLDEDGKLEIVVGDFDNNLYAFEHMVNNTYKRAFRSPDMMQFRPTNQTPYAWEQFGGYEGEFNQTIWNHVSYLVVNADIDQDGYKEILAVAGTVIYVFEATDIDDTYTLMARYDVLRNDEGNYIDQQGFDEPTGLAWANDMDKDGYCEIVVAFGKQVLIYEYIDGEFVETFGLVVPTGPDTGHYALPGNAEYYSQLTIAGVRITDLDADGYQEVVVFGDIGYQGWYETGFLGVIESRIDGYELVWQADTKYMLDNKILTVESADQDYDGHQELIVGGEKGVTIFEFNGTQQEMDFEVANILTGHANYPFMNSKGLFGVWNGKDLLYRSHDLIQLQYGTNHSFLAVWSQYNGTYWVPYYAFSDETGTTWYTPQQIEVSLIAVASLPNAYLPTVFQASTGRIYIGWVQRGPVLGQGAIWYFLIRYSDDYGNTWSNLHAVTVETAPSNPFRSPVFFTNGTTNDVGFAYVFKNSTTTIAKYGQYVDADGQGYVYGEINGTEGYILNGLDACTYPTGDRVGIVFSGVKPSENKPDYDMWYVELNSTYQAIFPARKIFDSPAIERTPSLTYLLTGNHSAIVTFDAAGIYTGKASSYAIVSENGVDWSEPDLIATYPEYVYPLWIGGHMYPRIAGYPYLTYYVKAMSFTGPEVTAVYGGGYAILTKFDMTVNYQALSGWDTEYHDDLLFQKQTVSNVDLTVLNKATDIAVGDSDGDGLNEILVADEHHARLYELFETGEYTQHYVNSWTSVEFENEVSDTAISDTNGNGFPELIMSVQGDDVYVYEVVNTTKPIVNLHTVKEQFMALNDSVAYHNSVADDFDQNGIQDIVVFTVGGEVYALFGENGTVAWRNHFYSDLPLVSGGTLNGKHAIMALQNDGKLLWYNATDGALTIVTLEGTVQIKGSAISYDYNGDGTDDIIGRNVVNEHLEIYNGLNGSLIKSISFGGPHVYALERGTYESKTVFFVGLSNNTVLMLSSDLSETLWADSSIQSTASMFFLVGDINNDSNDDVFVSGSNCYMYNSNGTILWSINVVNQPLVGELVDVNGDGLLDIILNEANTTTITTIDGRTGAKIWNYPTSKFTIIDLAVGNSNGETVIYFTFWVSAKLAGLGAFSIRGELLWLTPTDTIGTTHYAQTLVPTLINGEAGVIAPVQYKGVYGYTQTEFDYEPETVALPKVLKKDVITQRTLNVNADTVVYTTFSKMTEPTLFFVENDTYAVWYGVKERQVLKSVNITDYGKIVQAVAADPYGDGFYSGVYFRTDRFDFGFLNFDTMTVKWIAHEYGKIAEVYEMIAAPLYTGTAIEYYLLFVFKDVNNNKFVRCLDIDGNKLWTDVSLSSSFELEQLLAGPMLPTLDESSYMFVLRSSNNLFIRYLKDSVLYASEDGSFGLAMLSPAKIGDNHYSIVLRYGSQIRWYDVPSKTWASIMVLQSTEELLAMDTADVVQGDFLEVFASQNGTGIYAFNGYDNSILWLHKHSSFVADQLKVINESSGLWYVLTSDYHRLFLMDALSGAIESATYDRYTRIDKLLIYPADHSAEVSAVFLSNNAFYGYNAPAQFSFAETTDNLPLTTERIMKFTIPLAVMVGMTIATMVLFNRKPRK